MIDAIARELKTKQAQTADIFPCSEYFAGRYLFSTIWKGDFMLNRFI